MIKIININKSNDIKTSIILPEFIQSKKLVEKSKINLKNSSLKGNRYSIWILFNKSYSLECKKCQKEFYDKDKNR